MTIMQAAPVRQVRRAVRSVDEFFIGVGRLFRFLAAASLSAVRAARHYGSEMLRLVADMSLGSGALALIGGTVMITGFLTLFAGATVAVQGYSTLGNIGVDAMTGFLSAYVNIRVVVPVTAGIGLAATIGASTTAELGAMRISEEIDALEVMAIRAMPYLVGTRLLAGMITIAPIYAVALIFSFLSSRVVTVNVLGQSPGVYEHYFSTFLIPSDVLWSFLQAIVMAFLVMLICTYYGYYAGGGPEGVGVATGRAVRLSLIAVVTVTLVIALVLYGSARELRLAG
ncbi:ABC transporter permease [Gordonia sp. HY002]|uniref:ABC transporter permease n=1 Tax=Gordonia zhenghanii TaxID=2911516 RepID=UPI001EF15B8A|nr:ABC transporter permease [Gordonia zhenghanii]MCF8571246.1 ABC transporter permease [Gordonia zhenghanii]MCF8601770.1 ABC transporter permease [Gordonia zhenghanii]